MKQLGPPQVGKRLGVSRQTAVKLMRSGKIPGAYMAYALDDGREVWRIGKEELEEWISTRPGYRIYQS